MCLSFVADAERYGLQGLIIIIITIIIIIIIIIMCLSVFAVSGMGIDVGDNDC
jgi:heme/copper-type cytochrome/quinol oxidase subunit 2